MLLKLKLCLYLLLQTNDSIRERLNNFVDCPYRGDYYTKEDFIFIADTIDYDGEYLSREGGIGDGPI